MRFADQCRQRFSGAVLGVEDLFLLEPHEIADLEHRAPPRALAAVLHAHPALCRVLVRRCPAFAATADRVRGQHAPVPQTALAALADELVWEIADLLVYNVDPALYDQRAPLPVDLGDALDGVALIDRVIVDAGSGTGRVALAVAPAARHVFAVEPNGTLRRFLRQRVAERGIRNVYVVDGFLDAIPLPDGQADLLITAYAIGWRLHAELAEVERVVRAGGHAVHLSGWPADADDPGSAVLGDGGYRSTTYRDRDGTKKRFDKPIP